MSLKEAVNSYQLMKGHEALSERPFVLIVLSVEINNLNVFLSLEILLLRKYCFVVD